MLQNIIKSLDHYFFLKFPLELCAFAIKCTRRYIRLSIYLSIYCSASDTNNRVDLIKSECNSMRVRTFCVFFTDILHAPGIFVT